MTTSIEILRTTKPSLRWFPEPKDHTERFLARKEQELDGPNRTALERVLVEAQCILGRGLPPNNPNGHETGLVIGYVQSGKTLSFTTAISLARDNGYGLVIVLAGVQNNLKDQSEDRLTEDLGLNKDNSCWFPSSNPDVPTSLTVIRTRLEGWKEENRVGRDKKAILITVLKHGSRLKKLTEVLEQLSLDKVPALIIDDESDQASLNTKANVNRRQKTTQQSTIYKNILDLRKALPHHTYIQYTATPQANLLIESADLLSPSFVELVTPGTGYIGGKGFFNEKSQLIKIIPPEEVFSKDNPLTDPPPTLLSAIRFFLLGAAIHSYYKDKGVRSMMVHPSQLTDPHHRYKDWVENAVSSIKSYLRDIDCREAVAKLFQNEYIELKQAHSTLCDLPTLLGEMTHVLDDYSVVELNAKAQKNVKWRNANYWILIGGQVLNRGFTVKGLTVTYMPRPLGISPAADTLQQRARFFGYKESYLWLCRVFLQEEVREAFVEYVEHEEFIRATLEKWRGHPLKEWARDFELNQGLQPTRTNVISKNIKRISTNEWHHPSCLHVGTTATLDNNKIVFTNVKTSWGEKFSSVDASVYPQFHDNRSGKSERNRLIEDVPLSDVLTFMSQIKMENSTDLELHTALQLTMSKVLDKNPDAVADVFLMGESSQIRSRKQLEFTAPINQPFSGRNVNYVGDRALHSTDRLTLQLRTFSLKPKGVETIDIFDVPWYAVYVPENFDWVIESRS